MSMTIGKWRGLQQTTSPVGTFSVVAIDHRGPLRRALERQSQEPVSDEALTVLKQDIVRALSPVSSAMLLDPEVGAGQCVADGALDGQTGLIVALDTGSTGDPHKRTTSLVEHWSVEKACRMGASGVKLLIYYHPDASDASEIEALVEKIGQRCIANDIPFFLEPLSRTASDPAAELPSAEHREVVVETARRLVPLGADVLKAEFPADVAQQDDKQWRAGCQELSAACPVPWVLLSAGVSFETFVRQVRIACEAGASGVMAGRSVWSEAVTLDVTARKRFLREVACERMLSLRKLCDTLGRPFTALHEPPKLAHDWYRNYEWMS